MTTPFPIGFAAFSPSSQAAIASIKQAEQAGFSSVWIANPPVGPDPLSILMAAAVQTSSIKLGTAVMITYPRHPLALASQALAIEGIAPQRLRLGLGSSHPFIIESLYGLDFGKPLAHLREYVTVLRGILWDGKVDVTGDYFRVQVDTTMFPSFPAPPRTPILLATTRKKPFQLAGEISDGALTSWVPLSYLRSVALPAMQEGARKANRPKPPLIASTHIVFDTDFTNVRKAAYDALAMYTVAPAYQEVFAEAGFPLASDGKPSDELIHELFIYGDASTIRDRLYELHHAGADEIGAAIIPVKDPIYEEQAVTEILGSL